MRFERARAAKPGSPRSVRLGYCMNLHPSESLSDVEHALETFVSPLKARLSPGARFGVGMYLGAPVASALAADVGAQDALAARLRDGGIDPFTFNAFPYGGFQEDGLKTSVYAPTWMEPERLAYTVNVARVAARLNGERPGGHVSISTHPGAYGADLTDRSALRRCAENMARAVAELAAIREAGGPLIVLSIESEPDASARNARALAEYQIFARLVGSRVLQDEFGHSLPESGALMARHLGTCLDCCHSAVEFEEAAEAVRLAVYPERPTVAKPAAMPKRSAQYALEPTDPPPSSLGKIQFSSALRLPAPASAPGSEAALLALDEPRFLHQVTGLTAAGEFAHLADLPALSTELSSPDSPWRAAQEWRCHFHVPVDLTEAAGLKTTRAHADEILRLALQSGTPWPSTELHVEIETYTWSILPSAARSTPDDVVVGLEKEYAHVLGQLDSAGWSEAPTE